jgi:L-ribulose-5-phosphate 4-epimerase
MLSELKKRVLQANLDLVKNNLVIITWGNVSEIDKETGLVAIKPSGVPYDTLKESDIVIVDLNGKIIEGDLNPSSDLDTHLEIYRNYKNVLGICHTHSKWATIFSQANQSIKSLGTTHADYFHGNIPITRLLTESEVKNNYELNTGKVIVETIGGNDFLEVPAILCAGHGPFTVGTSAAKSVENSLVLERVAEMAYYTLSINNKVVFPNYILDQHYYRKHGKNAYYGQKEKH